MEKINLKHVKLYIEYSGEYALMFEKGVNDDVHKKITSEQFATIDYLVSSLQIIEKNYAGQKYIEGIKIATKEVRQRMDPDAYDEVVNGMGSFRWKYQDWINGGSFTDMIKALIRKRRKN